MSFCNLPGNDTYSWGMEKSDSGFLLFFSQLLIVLKKQSFTILVAWSVQRF